MLIDSKKARSPANEMAFMKRNLSPADLRAVRRGVGEAWGSPTVASPPALCTLCCR
jgi:hypothetical protein